MAVKPKGVLVQSGELVDWSHRGVPKWILVYRHGTDIALYNGRCNIFAPEDYLTDERLQVALRHLGHDPQGKRRAAI